MHKYNIGMKLNKLNTDRVLFFINAMAHLNKKKKENKLLSKRKQNKTVLHLFPQTLKTKNQVQRS